jgi:hypothetical protein
VEKVKVSDYFPIALYILNLLPIDIASVAHLTAHTTVRAKFTRDDRFSFIQNVSLAGREMYLEEIYHFAHAAFKTT